MKLFLSIIISFFLFNCSFDKKTGIWKDENNDINNVKNDTLKEFKKISASSDIYNKKIFIGSILFWRNDHYYLTTFKFWF